MIIDFEFFILCISSLFALINPIGIVPIFISIMAAIGSILMFSFNNKNTKFFNLSLGIISSVVIYYINYFFSLLGLSGRTSILLSVSFPLIVLSLFCFILLVKINEK